MWGMRCYEIQAQSHSDILVSHRRKPCRLDAAFFFSGRGMARPGAARRGKARRSFVFNRAGQGLAGRGVARRGRARQGKARLPFFRE